MDDETDYIKLPLDERCVHKLWKARVHGYEEAVKLFRRIEDEKAPEWNKFIGLIKKFVSDSNVAAQEKGLEAALAYIENAHVAGKTTGEVMPIIVTKCIGAPKAKIKELANQISLTYIEIEKQEIVTDELLKGSEAKNPKIQAACVNTLCQAIKEFGCKVLDVKSILKKLVTLLEDRDKNVREEAKSLTVELFKWIGPVLKTHLSSLKPIQLQELDAEFEKVKNEKPSVQRYLRSQQAKQSKASEISAVEGEIEDVPDNDDAIEIDPMDLIQAVDILSKLPNDFVEKLEAKKWQERKEVLDALEQLLINAPKLENGDYGDLVRAIKKVIAKDSNVILVGIACKCMAMLARGLKKKFQPFAGQCLPALLEKFKEKKQSVVAPLRDAVDAVYDSTTIEAVQEDVLASLDNKNPAVKAETVAFLARCFTKCNSLMLNKKLLKAYTSALLKTLNESDPVVRDNSAEAIGTAWKVVGEKTISPFLADVDKIKIEKIKEASEKAVITAKPPKQVKKAPPQEPTEKPKGGSINPKPVARKPVNKTATFVKKSSSTTNLSKKPIVSRPKSMIVASVDDEENDRLEFFDPNDLVARVDISSKITPALVDELTHRDWKIRAEAINKLQEIITESKFITNSLGEATSAISERLTDSNGRLAAASIALCESIAVAMGPSCKTYIRDFFPGMLQGLGDNKSYMRAAAIKCIETWGNTAGLRDFFESEMISSALKSGSPALRVELWGWLASKLPDIPVRSIPKEELMTCLPHLYNNLEDRNSDVRKNANDALYGFMIHLSYQTMYKACEKLKPVSVNPVKILLDRTRGNLPDIPAVKSFKPSSAPSTSTTQNATSNSKSNSSAVAKPKTQAKVAVPIVRKKADDDADISPLLKVNNLKNQRNVDENKFKVLKWNFTTPREEFVEQLKDQMMAANMNKNLIMNMFHSNFKLHLKAIDSLAEDLPNNLAALVSNLDLILKWHTLRFFDTNPSVILRGLEYLTLVFRALAEDGYNMMEMEAASFIPYLIIKTGDPKDTIRSLVKDIFDIIASIYPISKLFTYIMDGIKSKNARQRTGCLELLSRLIENYGLSVCQPSASLALKEIAKQISDRDTAVRNAALNCVVAAYFIAGDKIRQMIGQISDKDMSLLEERIKRASKCRLPNVPIATVKPTVCTSSKIPSQVDKSPPRINNDTFNCEHDSEDEMPADEEVYADEDLDPPNHPVDTSSPNNNFVSNLKRKHFSLDVDVIKAIERTSVVKPKANLIEYDMKYFEETVILPRMEPPVNQNYAYNTQTIVKSRASPPKPNCNSLEYLISVIGTTTDPTEIAEKAKMLDGILQAEDKRKELEGLEGQFISQLVKALICMSHHDYSEKTVENCYRCILTLLIKFFSFPNYAIQVNDTCLNQLLSPLIDVLVLKNIKKLDASESWIQKVINNLVLKILERSDHASVICALLDLLYNSVDNPSAPQNRQELIMKCVWKTIKFIPSWDDAMNYDKILCEIHRFFTDFPSLYWKKQKNDTPLRTYKTLVHAIVTARGSSILTTIHYIPGFNENCELNLYTNKLLRHMKLDEKNDPSDKSNNLIPRVQQEELAQIMRKIGLEEEKDQGFKMLYEFKEKYPTANIEQCISKTSSFFKNYVASGLEAVRAERETFLSRGNPDLLSDNINSDLIENQIFGAENGSGESLESDANHYQQKLKILQMRAGWDHHKMPSSTTANNSETSNIIPTLRINSPPQKTYGDADSGSTSLEQIRRKLSKLKNGN